MKPVAKQVVVITGASSGIGLASARAFAQRGAKLVLAARNRRDLERETQEIGRRFSAEASAVPTDVTDYPQVEALARRAVDEFGRIDTWVNNAGVTAYATFEEQPLEDFRRVLEVNFLGQVYGAKAALPYLKESGGALICVGSALSDRGVPLQSAYCASKHALKGWLDALRVELMHEGAAVRITLVKPSSIDTPLFSKAKTQLGVMPQPLAPIYVPELAAEAIVQAAARDIRSIYVGGAGRALALAEQISPRLLDLQQAKSGFEQQQTEKPKSGDAPNNLWAPVAHDGGATGEFTERAKRFSVYQQLVSISRQAPVTAAAGFSVALLALRRVLG